MVGPLIFSAVLLKVGLIVTQLTQHTLLCELFEWVMLLPLEYPCSNCPLYKGLLTASEKGVTGSAQSPLMDAGKNSEGQSVMFAVPGANHNMPGQ